MRWRPASSTCRHPGLALDGTFAPSPAVSSRAPTTAIRRRLENRLGQKISFLAPTFAYGSSPALNRV